MNILPMRHFLAVVEHGGISKAAAAQYVTQQTMSAHIAAIEKELGCVLFERGSHFRLTHEGETFKRYCERFIELSDDMSREFADIRDERGGRLRVGVAMTRGRLLMPKAIKRFHEELPHVEVELCESQNDALVQMLVAGEIDVMVGRIPGETAAYRFERLYEERLMLAVSRKLVNKDVADKLRATCDLRLISDVPFILSRENDIAGSFGRLLLREADVQARVAALSDSAHTIIALACLGKGAAFCPDALLPVCATPEELATLHLIPLDVRYQIGVAWRTAAYVDRRTEAFVRTMRELFATSAQGDVQGDA